MKAIAYNTNRKTYSVVTTENAQRMLFCGNPYGFNRATEVPSSGVDEMIRVFLANGYTEEKSK